MSVLIGLSAGHYPKKGGANFEGVSEHELAVKWVEYLSRTFESIGITVVQTPPDTLPKKVDALNRADVDFSIEIHFNGSNNPNVSGCETLYCPGSVMGKKLAKAVHSEYAPVMENTDRGVKCGWYRMDRPGIVDYPGDIDGDEHIDYFLLKTVAPAIILEPDFISQQHNINDKMESACWAIHRGVLNYVR